jgi:hypothetical protein
MFSRCRLPKLCGSYSALGWIVPAIITVSLLTEPASSLAARRARRANNKPVASATSQTASSAGRPTKIGTFNPSDETVDMFAAMEAGQISVRFIPKDSTQARVFIKNKSGKPLNVRLPKAFAAVPVLAQMGMGGMGGMGGGGGQGMGGGGGGMGGGGMFNVPADKEGNFKVACVCLEHGKPEPRPQMAYSMKPIESFTTKPGVTEMLTELGYNRIDQRAAQVAAWHLNNDMSWEELAGKRIDYLDGRSVPYFSQAELLAGRQIADEATAAAERAKKEEVKQPSPGETAAK